MTYYELVEQIVNGVVTDAFQVFEDDYNRLDQIIEDIERFIVYVFEGNVPPVSKQSLQVIYDKLLEDNSVEKFLNQTTRNKYSAMLQFYKRSPLFIDYANEVFEDVLAGETRIEDIEILLWKGRIKAMEDFLFTFVEEATSFLEKYKVEER